MQPKPDTSMYIPDFRGMYRCCKCGKKRATLDHLGYPWCKRTLCYYRREFLAWGVMNGYPSLEYRGELGKYGTGEGMWHWITTALVGDDTYVAAMNASIVELIESGAA